MKVRSTVAAVAVFLVVGSLLAPATAQPATPTTYTIEVGQDFFDDGIPGFSGRVYPGEITVHRGDTIHFTQGSVLFARDIYPQDYIPENVWRFDGQYSFIKRDPDEGATAFKGVEGPPGTCGSQANPCVWDGGGDDIIFPEPPDETQEPPDLSMWVVVNAAPGTTLWANTFASSEINTNIAVHVVGANEPASTQANLDARAAALKQKDHEDALALHNRMNAKRSAHANAAGQRVYDIFVGADAGPIELLAMYPKRISVPRGARVQFHFMDELEPHTATFGGPAARNLFFNLFTPVCDPDGDTGTAPDQPAAQEGAPCADMTQFELDVDNRALFEFGDRSVEGNGDIDNSGLKAPQFPEEIPFDAQPWTVRMVKSSSEKGWKYICLVHGPFMGGRIRVR